MKKITIISFILIIGLSSCVSKRKFEELAKHKLRSDEKVDELTINNNKLQAKLTSTLSEFSEVRYQLTYNNSKKDSIIDLLSNTIKNIKNEKESLEDKTTQDSEKISYITKSKEAKIEQLKAEIKQIKAKSQTLAESYHKKETEYKFSLDKKGTQIILLNDQIKAKEIEINNLKKDVKKLKGKASWLRKLNKKDKAEIEKLSNQVKLLKKALSN